MNTDKDVMYVAYDDSDFYKSHKPDCNKCVNQNTVWCSDCDWKYRSPNNFDFYREKKNKYD